MSERQSLTQHTRLRLTDVKAGHFERKVQALELEISSWEKRYEELDAKHKAVNKELEDLNSELNAI